MTHLTHRLAATALLSAATALASLPALAASSTSSAASDGASASVGSSSTSIEKSSASSSGDKKVADGDYRIIDVAAAPGRPGMARVKLQAVADTTPAGEFFLVLPQEALEQSRLAQGGTVTARQKPYGTEFAHGQTRQAFFLVLADDWLKELQTTPLVL